MIIQLLAVSSYGQKDSSQVAESKKEMSTDSIKFDLKERTSSRKDSSSNKNQTLQKVKQVFPTGNISIGYDYGFLPYTINTTTPASAIKTEGLIGFDVFNIPIDVTYFYSTQKNLIGLTNYFRVSYNADRYKDKMNSKLAEDLELHKKLLTKLNNQNQQLLQKMAYTDYLNSIPPDKWPINNPKIKSLTPEIDSAQIDGKDTLKFNYKYTKKSQNSSYLSKEDSLRQRSIYYKNKSDSVAKMYDTYSKQYDALNDSIKKTKYKIEELDSLRNNGYSSYSYSIPYLNKAQNIISGIKKFDIGLCYPNYSTFLANNIPVRGLNMEYQKNDRFFGFTYGTTVSTLLYNNKNIEGFLQNVRNSYNYFDVNNLSSGRKILSAKFGVGSKEGSHCFAGFLVGKGASSYFNVNPSDVNITSRESNLVVEADIRQKLKRNTTLDIIIGKSSLQEADLNMDIIKTAAKEVFSNYRSFAALTKLNTKIVATKTNLTFSVRWIDPFFKSFGIGFIRSDNLRYEIKADQPIGKRMNYKVMFRYEEDNVLKLLNYKNTFYSINNTLSCKIKRGLTLRVGYTPLIRDLKGENYHIQSKNSITTGIVTFTPRGKKVQKQFNLLYNYYLVSTDSSQINFQNFAYYHQILLKKGFKTGLNVSWFKNNLKDTAANDIFLGVLDFGYQFKNGTTLTIAGKSAYKLNGLLYPGFIVKSNIKICKSLFWGIQAEKFIIGDLFNGYDLEMLKKFPYYFNTNLSLNF